MAKPGPACPPSRTESQRSRAYERSQRLSVAARSVVRAPLWRLPLADQLSNRRIVRPAQSTWVSQSSPILPRAADLGPIKHEAGPINPGPASQEGWRLYDLRRNPHVSEIR
jgi:hypothetical protein